MFWQEHHVYTFDDDKSSSVKCAARTVVGESVCVRLSPLCGWKGGRCMPTKHMNDWKNGTDKIGSVVNSVTTGRPFMITHVVNDGVFEIIALREGTTTIILFPSFTFGDIGPDTNAKRTNNIAAIGADLVHQISIENKDITTVVLCGHSMGAVTAQKTFLQLLRGGKVGHIRLAVAVSAPYLWASPEVAREIHDLSNAEDRISFVHPDDKVTRTVGTGHDMDAVQVEPCLAILGGGQFVDASEVFLHLPRFYGGDEDSESDSGSDEDEEDPHEWVSYASLLSQYSLLKLSNRMDDTTTIFSGLSRTLTF